MGHLADYKYNATCNYRYNATCNYRDRWKELGIIIEGTDRAPRYRRGKADVATPMRSTEAEGTKLKKPLGLAWIKCPYPVLAAGVEQVLKEVAHVHCGKSPSVLSPPSCIVLMSDDEEDVTSEVKDLLALVPNTPVLIFSSRADDQRLAKAALPTP